MKLVKPRSPSGFTVFCDDIRQENTGKAIYVGVYTAGEMQVALPPPVSLPGFCFAITFIADPGYLKGPVIFKVYAPTGTGDDEVVAQMTVSSEQTAQMPHPTGPDAETLMVTANVVFQLSPLLLKGPGRLKARAECDGVEYALGSLGVKFPDGDLSGKPSK